MFVFLYSLPTVFVSPTLAVPTAQLVLVLANAKGINEWQSKGSLTRTNQPSDRETVGEDGSQSSGESKTQLRASQYKNDKDRKD